MLDPCLVTSPNGALPFNVVVHDIASNPVAGSQVVLDFSTCPAAVLCPTTCTGCAFDSPTRTVRKFTNALGAASFDLHMGGACGAGSVRIYADGVLIGTREVASLDQNADLSVTAADLALVGARLGSHDPTADLDCSGTVDAADQALLQSHLGTTCAGVTTVRPGTWGGVKILYR